MQLRLDLGTTGEAHAELRVALTAQHPGLMQVSDFGPLPGGGFFLARNWVHGEPLSNWVKGRTPKELGRVIGHLALALHALHRSGFVHADLKAENVLVGEDQLPVLIDYGHSCSAGEVVLGGSWYAAAPEQLRAEPLGPAADAFSLGALFHGLLVDRRAAPDHFHGAFPADDFFQASETEPTDLPAWSRDIVQGLVRRKAADRTESCAAVAHQLQNRLGFAWAPGWDLPPRPPRIEPWLGEARGDFLRQRLSSLGTPGIEVWCTDPEEHAEPLAAQARVQAALQKIPLATIDLSVEVAGLSRSRELGAWAQATVREHSGMPLLVHGCRGVAHFEAWRWLARSRQATGAARTILLRQGKLLRATEPWDVWRVPPVSEEDVAQYFHSWCPDEDGRLPEVVARFHAESLGSAARLTELVDAWIEGGAVRWSGAWKLRHGDLLSRVARMASKEADGRARAEIEAVVSWLPKPDMRALSEVLGLDAEKIERDVSYLAESGRIARDREGGFVATRAVPRLGPTSRDLHLRVGQWLEEQGGRSTDANLHLYVGTGKDPHLAVVLEDGRRLTMDEQPHAAIDLLLRVRMLCEDCARPLTTACLEILGEAHAAAGDMDAAHHVAEELASRGGAMSLARAARVRGRIAQRLGDYEASASQFGLARDAGYDPDGSMVHVQAMALAKSGDWDGLDRLAATAPRPEDPRAKAALEINLVSLAVPRFLREGRFVEARDALIGVQQLARHAGETRATAPIEINLALVARAEGRLEMAETHLNLALEVYLDAGLLAGVAQVEAALGNLMRDSGRLSEAQDWLERSLEKRRLLGQDSAALLVRGGLSFVLAERGHVLPARQELRSVGEALQDGSRDEERELIGLHLALQGYSVGEDPPAIECPAFHRGRLLWARYRWLVAGDQAGALAALEKCQESENTREEALWLSCAIQERSGALPGQGLSRLRALTHSALVAENLDSTHWGLAEDLSMRGADALAARTYLALGNRGPEGQRPQAIEHARRHFLRCAEGLGESQRQHLLTRLLGIPDPRPDECQLDEDLDMEVIEILEINRLLVEQQDLPTLLRTIVECAVSASGAERGFLALEWNGVLSLDQALDSSYGEIEMPEVEVSYTALREALQVGRTLRSAEAGDHPMLAGAASVESLALRSILATPFEVEPGLRGVLYLDHRSQVGAFDARSERLIGLLSGQASLAIRQVRRLEDIQRLKSELEAEVVDQGTRLAVAQKALQERGAPVPLRGLVGDSAPMRRIHDLLARVAPTDLSVLVLGASGTGKELAARALHDLSLRAENPFVAENCAAIPESLLEAELFGSSKGAFTGAERVREGLFGRAHTGTLFLDEIGELPLDLQAKLLRVIETRRVRRIGDDEEREVDFRLVAATHQDLDAAVAEGRFRADLLYRLDGMRVLMPALEERLEDLPLLVDHFLRLDARRTGMERRCAPEVMRALGERGWPGNVRELANEVARLCILSDGDLKDPGIVRSAGSSSRPRSVGVRPLAEIEREAIELALEQTGGDKRRAAQLLGISRAKVYQRLKEWGSESQ